MAAFWDTSAIIHICVPGQSLSGAKRVLSRHAVVVWRTARVEVRRAIERLRKEAAISPRAYDASCDRLEALLASWREIQPTESLREIACVQLERFSIRVANALHGVQMASAARTVLDLELFRRQLPDETVETNLKGVLCMALPASYFDVKNASAAALVKRGVLLRRPSPHDRRRRRRRDVSRAVEPMVLCPLRRTSPRVRRDRGTL